MLDGHITICKPVVIMCTGGNKKYGVLKKKRVEYCHRRIGLNRDRGFGGGGESKFATKPEGHGLEVAAAHSPPMKYDYIYGYLLSRMFQQHINSQTCESKK